MLNQLCIKIDPSLDDVYTSLEERAGDAWVRGPPWGTNGPLLPPKSVNRDGLAIVWRQKSRETPE